MLMRPNKAETAVHGCHCPGDMAVRMRKVLARPWVGVRVCHLLLLLFNQCLTKPRSKPFLFSAERFYVNTIYCEQLYESIMSRLEEHFSS